MRARHSTTPVGERHTDRELARQWNSIDWDEVKSRVNRLQTRIAKATREEKLSSFAFRRPTIGL
ncbi:MAG: reverse transcriptase N-terminal domain-containing protein [Euryarchaeota archaeon]|nr:reverse transcriptase N-terminal domain-containing protein [Euryarchaeota archaeon]